MDNRKLAEIDNKLAGTWSLDVSKIPEAIKELQAFKNKYYKTIGDDLMFDGIDSAIERLMELKNLN